MRLILLLIVLLMLLGAAAGAGWYLFLRPPSEEELAAQAEAEANRPPAPPIFVEFNPIQVPIVDDDSPEQLVNVILALEVDSQADADRIITLAPRLNDAFLIELYGGLSTDDLIGDNQLVNVERLKRRLMQAADRVLGEGAVNDVLIQLVSQRPI